MIHEGVESTHHGPLLPYAKKGAFSYENRLCKGSIIFCPVTPLDIYVWRYILLGLLYSFLLHYVTSNTPLSFLIFVRFSSCYFDTTLTYPLSPSRHFRSFCSRYLSSFRVATETRNGRHIFVYLPTPPQLIRPT